MSLYVPDESRPILSLCLLHCWIECTHTHSHIHTRGLIMRCYLCVGMSRKGGILGSEFREQYMCNTQNESALSLYLCVCTCLPTTRIYESFHWRIPAALSICVCLDGHGDLLLKLHVRRYLNIEASEFLSHRRSCNA